MLFETSYNVNESKIIDVDSYIKSIETLIELGNLAHVNGHIHCFNMAGEYKTELLIEYLPNEMFSIICNKRVNNILNTSWSYNGDENLSQFIITDSECVLPECSLISLKDVGLRLQQFFDHPMEIGDNIDGWIGDSQLDWPDEINGIRLKI